MRRTQWALAPVVVSTAMTMAHTAWAADAPAVAEAPSFDFSGHLDIGYPGLSGKGKFTNGINDRVFDFDRKGLTLHAVDLQVRNCRRTASADC